jgi:hypothetical protein
MAKAEARSEVITIKRDTVRLDLSVAEAETLAAVLGMVQGHPTNSPRKMVQEIKNALSAAGVRHAAMPVPTYRSNSFAALLTVSNRHSAELVTDSSRIVFREYPTSWSKAERGEDN